MRRVRGDPQIGLLDPRIGTHLRGRVGGDDLAIDENGDPVGQFEYDVHVVFDNHYRAAVV
jgi:hypothetical protein